VREAALKGQLLPQLNTPGKISYDPILGSIELADFLFLSMFFKKDFSLLCTIKFKAVNLVVYLSALKTLPGNFESRTV
jgi:hypothetical protein